MARTLELYNSTNVTGQPDGSFSASDNAYRVSAAFWMLPGTLSWGATLKYLQSGIDDATSSGYGLDAGLLYLAGHGLSLGLALDDPFTVIQWSTGLQERPSTTLHLGGAWNSGGLRPLTVSLQAGQSGSKSISPNLGLEWEALPSTGWLRAGLADQALTFGLGLRLKVLAWAGQLDYALSTDASHDYNLGASDLVHRVDLTVFLGD